MLLVFGLYKNLLENTMEIIATLSHKTSIEKIDATIEESLLKKEETEIVYENVNEIELEEFDLKIVDKKIMMKDQKEEEAEE